MKYIGRALIDCKSRLRQQQVTFSLQISLVCELYQKSFSFFLQCHVSSKVTAGGAGMRGLLLRKTRHVLLITDYNVQRHACTSTLRGIT